MSKPMIRIHNVETDEIIEREMTDKEFKEYTEFHKNQEIIKEEAQAKLDAKINLLKKLGITEEEANLLLS